MIVVMREVNLRTIDINLLTVLDALLERAHVTEAAQALNMSQPAVSRALARLRAMFGDPLLVRGGEGLVLTARAETLRAQLTPALSAIKNLVSSEPFNPATAKGTFTITATDSITILMLPRLMATLFREAPLLDVRVVPFSAETLADAAQGKIDIVIGIEETERDKIFRSEPLFTDRFVTLLRSGHPAAKDWSLDRYLSLDHVLITIFGDGKGAIDMVLERAGLSRRIALRLPHFVAAMSIVSTSDLVLTAPATIAKRYAKELNLKVLETPVDRPPFTNVSIWSQVFDADPAHQFLRRKVVEAAGGIKGALPMAEVASRPAIR
jgi:DNA-binding transcriptional LysR family regulator